MNNSVSTATGKAKIKVVMLGDQSVGKSSIIEKYVNDRFDQSSNPTVGIDFLAKNTTYKNKSYRLQLWDTAGQQRFRSMIPSYLKDAHCALIVYDVTSAHSLSNIDVWLRLYQNNKIGEGFVFLVGNKIDLEDRQISVDEGIKKAEQLRIPYFQISAKNGLNLQSLFQCIIEGCTQKNTDVISLGMFGSKKKKNNQIIKQQGEKEEEEVKTKSQKTNQQNLKVQSPKKQNNIVLTNQKIKNSPKKKKSCC